MTDLTDGYHYAIIDGNECIIEKRKNLKHPYYRGFCVERYECLGKVPSYGEHMQLKELLKECKQWFDWYHIDTGTGKEYIESWHKKGRKIHKHLDEVLR